MKKDKLITAFPWQRLLMTVLFDASMIYVAQRFVDWLYYFVVIDPTLTNPSVQTAAITALSAGMGVLFVCFAAVNIWFITGSVRTVEAMFKFNAATMAQTSLQAVGEAINETRTERIEQIIEEGAPGSPDRRPFRTYDDEP